MKYLFFPNMSPNMTASGMVMTLAIEYEVTTQAASLVVALKISLNVRKRDVRNTGVNYFYKSRNCYTDKKEPAYYFAIFVNAALKCFLKIGCHFTWIRADRPLPCPAAVLNWLSILL